MTALPISTIRYVKEVINSEEGTCNKTVTVIFADGRVREFGYHISDFFSSDDRRIRPLGKKLFRLNKESVNGFVRAVLTIVSDPQPIQGMGDASISTLAMHFQDQVLSIRADQHLGDGKKSIGNLFDDLMTLRADSQD